MKIILVNKILADVELAMPTKIDTPGTSRPTQVKG